MLIKTVRKFSQYSNCSAIASYRKFKSSVAPLMVKTFGVDETSHQVIFDGIITSQVGLARRLKWNELMKPSKQIKWKYHKELDYLTFEGGRGW